jgi:hypothetical protein
MSDYLRSIREGLAETVNQDLEDFADGAILTGYVVIAEWSTTDGQRWITKTAGDLNDEGPPVWTVEGWLWHALTTAQRDVDEAREEQE